ncbi:hypothetical protein QBC46DRAFT_453539 [Diplogelasinospora grovesii]|uniref:Uncharacterized protein n=1 Tax=Diplogelasinospora grovesii TaxID=303347 RepID=A0AAN6RZ91_9PEZI|nr:hypothetical protein QBC46DRAFT_453539 [Diplogelasinospora grovesii]
MARQTEPGKDLVGCDGASEAARQDVTLPLVVMKGELMQKTQERRGGGDRPACVTSAKPSWATSGDAVGHVPSDQGRPPSPAVSVLSRQLHDWQSGERLPRQPNVFHSYSDRSAVQCIPTEIVIIIAKEGVQQTQVSQELLRNLAHSSTELISEFFSGLRFIKISKDELTTSKGCSQLRRHLYKASSRARHKRADLGLLFSANHFTSFSEIAFNHLLLPELFQFTKAARLQNTVASDLAEHLGNFLNEVKSVRDLMTLQLRPSRQVSCWIIILRACMPLNPVMSFMRCIGMLACMLRGWLLRTLARVDYSYQNMNLLYEEYLARKSTPEIHLKGSKLS